jgi:hypothetical protein
MSRSPRDFKRGILYLLRHHNKPGARGKDPAPELLQGSPHPVLIDELRDGGGLAVGDGEAVAGRDLVGLPDSDHLRAFGEAGPGRFCFLTRPFQGGFFSRSPTMPMADAEHILKQKRLFEEVP